MPVFADPLSLRVALERQLALMVPVAHHLRAEAGSTLAPPDDWRGPAAAACRDREADLRELLRVAAESADDTVVRLRLALAGLP